MKFISTKYSDDLSQLVCEDGIFDPSLIKEVMFDKEENVLFFTYDTTECGNPLGLPFYDEYSAIFVAKITERSLHVSVSCELSDKETMRYKEYINEAGALEFIVRLSESEKMAALTTFISLMSMYIKDECKNHSMIKFL